MPRPTATTKLRVPQARSRPGAPAKAASSADGGANAIAATLETGSAEAAALEAKVLAVLELIRPAIQADGGDIELVEVSGDGDVTVRLLGACVGCPSSGLTLRNGIERQLRERVAQVRSVRADDRSPRRG